MTDTQLVRFLINIL